MEEGVDSFLVVVVVGSGGGSGGGGAAAAAAATWCSPGVSIFFSSNVRCYSVLRLSNERMNESICFACETLCMFSGNSRCSCELHGNCTDHMIRLPTVMHRVRIKKSFADFNREMV